MVDIFYNFFFYDDELPAANYFIRKIADDIDRKKFKKIIFGLKNSNLKRNIKKKF